MKNPEFVDEVLKTIAYHNINEYIMIRYDEKGPHFWVDCSDLHWWGLGYGLEITPDNLEEFKECLNYNDLEGHLLFCCREYEMRPQGAYYQYIDSNMWLAFDNCGPLRESGFMNPEIQKFNDETYVYNLERYANEMFDYLTYPYINYKDEIVTGEDIDND